MRIPAGDSLRQRVGGQRAGGHDHVPLLRDVQHLPLHHRDVGVAADFFRDGGGEGVAVHRQGAPRLHPVGVGAGHNEGAAPAQLLLQKPHRVLQLVGAQGVGAHQLPEIPAVVGGGHLLRLHLPQFHRDAPLGQLPGRFAAGQTGAYHDHRFHGFLLSFGSQQYNPASPLGLPA